MKDELTDKYITHMSILSSIKIARITDNKNKKKSTVFNGAI